MKIIVLILLSLFQTFDTSGNRALTDSIIKNPEILLEIGQDTNYVTFDFYKCSKKAIYSEYPNYISNYFTKKKIIIELDTIITLCLDYHCLKSTIGNEIIYYSVDYNKYLYFGFNLIDDKWKLSVIKNTSFF